MSEIRTQDDELTKRLLAWGTVFRLDRPLPLLWHRPKNMLQVYFEHNGEFPAKSTGYKPQEVDVEAWEIECHVAQVFREAPVLAWCLRAFYCGSGRKGKERFEAAQSFVKRNLRLPLSRRSFYRNVAAGKDRVGELIVQQRNAKNRVPPLTTREFIGL